MKHTSHQTLIILTFMKRIATRKRDLRYVPSATLDMDYENAEYVPLFLMIKTESEFLFVKLKLNNERSSCVARAKSSTRPLIKTPAASKNIPERVLRCVKTKINK